MGSSMYSGFDSISDATYSALADHRKRATGSAAFSHSHDIRSGKVDAKVHDRVDPTKIVSSVSGKRESRDVNEILKSNAVAVLFDVTGSMGGIPVVLQQKLTKLMAGLTQKGVVDNPQVLFGAIGDATCDNVPVQVGQFEADLAMDEDLDKFYLEGGGGGQVTESYELGLFFLARLTSIDCYEKRNKKGYAFIIGDETAYSKVKRGEVKKVFNVDIQDDIPIQDIIKEVQEKYELFFIVPTSAQYGTRNKGFWTNLLGQHVLELDNPDLVCETIVTTIGIAEGVLDSAGELADVLKMDKSAVNSVSRAVSVYGSTRANKRELAEVVSGSVPGGRSKSDLE